MPEAPQIAFLIAPASGFARRRRRRRTVAALTAIALLAAPLPDLRNLSDMFDRGSSAATPTVDAKEDTRSRPGPIPFQPGTRARPI